MTNKIKPLSERFFSKVNKDTDSGCWEWTAHCIPKGYGHIRVGNRMRSTHRVSWEIHFGEIPAGKWVLHHCDNRKCVNPEHLYLGTLKENVRDTLVRNRQAKGDRNSRRAAFLASGGPDMTLTSPPSRKGPAKLNDEKVRVMRQMFAAGYRCADLAGIFGVHTATVSCAITRRSWRHVA